MAAIFLPIDDDSGIFKHSCGNSSNLISCSLTDRIGHGTSSILSAVSVTFNETVQFFQSFDDLVHFFYFGQGLGSIHLEIMCFQNCGGGMPGLQAVINKISQSRGKLVSVDLNAVRVEGVLLEFSVSLVADPVPIYTIAINLGMTKNGLQKPNIKGSC